MAYKLPFLLKDKILFFVKPIGRVMTVVILASTLASSISKGNNLTLDSKHIRVNFFEYYTRVGHPANLLIYSFFQPLLALFLCYFGFRYSKYKFH